MRESVALFAPNGLSLRLDQRPHLLVRIDLPDPRERSVDRPLRFFGQLQRRLFDVFENRRKHLIRERKPILRQTVDQFYERL